MSDIKWLNGTSGDWSDGADWAGGTPPAPGDRAIIDAPGTYTVTISTAVTADPLDVESPGATVDDRGTLALGGTLQVLAGTFKLDSGGAVVGGSVQADAGTFLWNGGILDGVSLTGTLDLTPNGSTVTIVDGLTMAGQSGGGPGVINMNGNEGTTGPFGSLSSVLTFQGTQTLDNVTVNMGGAFIVGGYGSFADNEPPAEILVTGTNPVLTLGPLVKINHTGFGNLIILGDGSANETIVNNGTINATAVDAGFALAPPDFQTPDSVFFEQDFQISPARFVNNGIITVANGDLLDIGGSGLSEFPAPSSDTFINNGTITVSGSGLQIHSLNWQNNGTIQAINARLAIAGSLATAGRISAVDSYVIVGDATTAQVSRLFGGGGNTLSVTGTLDNRGQTLEIGTGSAFSQLALLSPFGIDKVLGGTIRDSGNGLASGGDRNGLATLDGVTYDGTLNLAATAEASLTIVNGLRMHGLDGTGSGTIDIGQSGGLFFVGTQTLDNATVNAVTDGSGINTVAFFGNSGGTLTLGRHATVTDATADVSVSCDGLVNDGTLFVDGISATSLTNNGSIAVLFGLPNPVLIAATSVVNNGTITDIFGDLTGSGGFIDATTLVNNGTLTLVNSSVDSITAAKFTSNGTIGFEGGQLTIKAPLDGTGHIAFGNGGTLDIAQSCAAGQTILFEDNQADTLRLDDAAGFHGTIAGFGPGDTIDLAGVSASSAAFSGNMIVVTLSGGGTVDLAVSGDYQGTGLAVAADGTGGTDLTVVPGQTFTLTARADTVAGRVAANTILAAAGALSTGDRIDGGPASNTLMLQGGGTFNLRAPTSLTGISVISAHEAEGGSRQTVYLRDGLDATVAVATTMSDPANPAAAGITIYGAANSDVIELGRGNDTVYLGAGETVNGGGGSNVFVVAGSALASTAIHGGSGQNLLEITGGGTVTMPVDATGIASVWLTAAPAGQTQPDYVFTANASHGLQIVDKSSGNDTIAIGDASQIVQAGNGNVTVKASAASAGALLQFGTGHNVLEIISGGTATLNALTSNITVTLDDPTTLILSGKSGVTAIGSTGSDTIIAKASGQVLTGNGGGDTLIGYLGGGDIFRDTASGLGNAEIENFAAPNDAIDVTDLGFGPGTTLGYSQGAADGVLTLGDATHHVGITLFGQFAAAGFHTATDGAGGTAITYAAPPHTQSPVIAASRG